MKSFFKMFFASFLALAFFCFVFLFFVFLIIGVFKASMSTDSKTTINQESILVLNLSQPIAEQGRENFSFNGFSFKNTQIAGTYDLVQIIKHAKNNKNIKGIYIKSSDNPNGFASSQEIRKALQDFKASKKFIIAHAPTISQKAYYIASIADSIYTHPQGGMEWKGLSSEIMFYKGALDKFEVDVNVFYAGKFKSATEPFRSTSMTDANRLQTAAWLNSLYNTQLQEIGKSRNINPELLHQLADKGAIQSANDAIQHKLITGSKYEDEIIDLLQKLMKLDKEKALPFISTQAYYNSTDYNSSDINLDATQIAIVYAEGDIVSTEEKDVQIASKKYTKILREIRENDDIKALVLRINSPGGSALASDEIWHEIALTQKRKPVVVSMGDVAASGGYYIAAAAQKIFANANTITGSIGVFTIAGNIEKLLKNKIGITFDRVKTANHADFGSLTRPMNEAEKIFIQNAIDSIYYRFKSIVASGRKRTMAEIEEVAQGRVWIGTEAQKIGLVDEIGTLEDAVQYTAKFIKAQNNYTLVEYPESSSWVDKISKSISNEENEMAILEKHFGKEALQSWKNAWQIQNIFNQPQTRLPFTFDIK